MVEKRPGRWFRRLGGRRWNRHELGMVPFQVALSSRVDGIPEPIARMVYEEYVINNGQIHSFAELNRRGGFSVTEVVSALADIIERERAMVRELPVPKTDDGFSLNGVETQYLLYQCPHCGSFKVNCGTRLEDFPRFVTCSNVTCLSIMISHGIVSREDPRVVAYYQENPGGA